MTKNVVESSENLPRLDLQDDAAPPAHARLELIVRHTTWMSNAKPPFAVAAIVVFPIATVLCAWTTWHYVHAWPSPPPNAITSETSSPKIPAPAVVPLQPPATPGPGEKFLGTWTGHWDNTLAARFTITRQSSKQFAVTYESEAVPGQPMSKKFLHPWANDKVLHMPRASIILTMSNTLPNTAHGVVTITVGDTTTVRSATFVRGGERTVANWLPPSASAAATTQPIVLDIKATIDGSDVLNLSPKGAVWTHKEFQWPTDISVNGVAWDAHTQPTLSDVGLGDVDLSTGKVISRIGRDRVEMENTPDGVAINFDDSPPGSAPYEIKIRFDRK